MTDVKKVLVERADNPTLDKRSYAAECEHNGIKYTLAATVIRYRDYQGVLKPGEERQRFLTEILRDVFTLYPAVMFGTLARKLAIQLTVSLADKIENKDMVIGGMSIPLKRNKHLKIVVGQLVATRGEQKLTIHVLRALPPATGVNDEDGILSILDDRIPAIEREFEKRRKEDQK